MELVRRHPSDFCLVLLFFLAPSFIQHRKKKIPPIDNKLFLIPCLTPPFTMRTHHRIDPLSFFSIKTEKERGEEGETIFKNKSGTTRDSFFRVDRRTSEGGGRVFHPLMPEVNKRSNIFSSRVRGLCGIFNWPRHVTIRQRDFSPR